MTASDVFPDVLEMYWNVLNVLECSGMFRDGLRTLKMFRAFGNVHESP